MAKEYVITRLKPIPNSDKYDSGDTVETFEKYITQIEKLSASLEGLLGLNQKIPMPGMLYKMISNTQNQLNRLASEMSNTKVTKDNPNLHLEKAERPKLYATEIGGKKVSVPENESVLRPPKL